MTHYYDEDQTSKLRITKINTTLLENSFDLYTASGVFSIKKVDRGTEVLIKNAIIKDSWNILDLGCGIGVIGIAIKLAFPKTKITMSDINKRAIKITKKNLKLNKISDIEPIHSDLFENITGKFDTIISNPPTHAGREICFKIIEESPKYLNSGGLLQIVARHNKGGNELSKKMEKVFGNIKHTARKSGFRVYVSEKK